MKLRHAIAKDSAAVFKLVNQPHPSMGVEQGIFQRIVGLFGNQSMQSTH